MKPDKDKDTKPAAKKPNGKVFDVSRPGKTPAEPTSKPVISGHKPEAQASQISVSGVGEARPLLNRKKILITPLGEAKAVDDTLKEESPKGDKSKGAEAQTQPTQEETEGLGTAALDAATTGPPELHQDKAPVRMHTQPKLNIKPISENPPEDESEDQPAATEPEKPAEETVKPEETEPEPEAESATAEGETAETEPTSKPEPELAAEELPAETSSMPEAEPVEKTDEKEEPAPEPVIEPLFDESGAIVVSNHEHHHRRHGAKVFFLLLLILILAAVALDIVLDLGLLTIEGIPHTDFL